MKKVSIIFLLAITYSLGLFAQINTACCPEFSLKFKRDFDCTKTQACSSANGGSEFTASMCKYSTNTFLVVPNLAGYSYTWVVTGGVPSSTTANPINITWGGGSTGTILVTITSADGKCVKTIQESICLRDAPKALFTFTPNNACAGLPVSFTNTSVGGAAVSWDFGDGTFAGNVNAPTHVYAAAGTYQVTITVYGDTVACAPSVQPTPGGVIPRPCCGCNSTFTLMVTVVAGTPLTIVPKECINQCLCVGDTAEYCATTVCGTYNWTVSGGTIISGAGTQFIKIKWIGPYPTSITLNTPGCGNVCGNTATLNVPVLVNNIPILPNTSPVCANSIQTYYLPAMPGAFYTWTVIGGTIIGPSLNTASIVVKWGPGPSGTVSCTYQNPLKPGCSGSSTRTLSIRPVLKINGPSKTCEGCTASFFTGGGSVTWSAVPSVGVTFSPLSGSSTVVAFPVTGTTSTYTIIGTGGAGFFCNSPQSAGIIVAPKPVLTLTTTTPVSCPGVPIKFVATSTITTSPITWVLPSGAIMVANTGTQLDTAVIQFATLPATVTVTQNCAFNLSCSQGTATFTITKPPVPSLNTAIINPCVDQTVSYSISNAVAGVNYNWTISNTLGTIVSGQGTSSINILWHGGSPNTAVLTVSNCSGSSIPVTITVTLPVFPTITVSGTCIKSGMTLTSSTAGPYLWSGPGVTGQTTATVSINQPGQYCVTINSASLGSCAQQKCITIPPNPYWVKIIPPCSVSSCNPNSLSVLLTVQTNIGSPTGCKWMFDPAGGPVVFSQISIVCGNLTATALGSYYLIYTDANGCKDTSNTINIPNNINICCSKPVCNALSATNFNFTHSGCKPTNFIGTPLSLPPGWTTGTIQPTICYGDGTSDNFISLNTSHQYPAAGLYTACVVQKVVKISSNDTCCIITCKQVTIPVVTFFNAAYNCNTGLLNMADASSYYPTAAGAIYTWTVTGGTFTPPLTNAATQTITPTSSGIFTITLSITLAGCTSTYTTTVNVVLPATTISISPNPSCNKSPVFFTTPAGMASYYWTFGDSYFSYLQNPEHIYAAPGTYAVQFTAVTPQGCTIIKNGTVTIQPKPTVTLSLAPGTICPGGTALITAVINANGNTMCPTFTAYSLQLYNNGVAYGAPIVPYTTPISVNGYGTFYAVLTPINPSCNCVLKTDTVLLKMFPKPIAKIKGNSTVCLSFGTGTTLLENEVAGYTTYAWTANSPFVTFSPANTFNTTVSVSAPGNYQVFLAVTDANGCIAKDTLCIYATNSPTALITPPGGTLCSGNIYALQAVPTPATAPPAGYNYLWNTTATTNIINASAAGVYYAFVTDMNTGCSATTNVVTINKMPDVSLFPSCCDTICDNAPINIQVPLPLIVGQNICTVYNIVWLDNGVPISPQPNPCNILNTATLVPLLGLHNISIAVTLNGCTDTSNVFNLFIKHCDDCDCKGSHWGEIQLTEVEIQLRSTSKASTSQKINPIILKCNKSQQLDCNTIYTINAKYFCKDSTCNGKVTYSLQTGTGGPITGNAPFTFTTPAVNTVFILKLYGWCGNKICDSCTIDLIIKCDENCDCKGSRWGEQIVTINNSTQQINCKKIYEVKCKQPVTINANYLCADSTCISNVTYLLQPPSGGPTTGNVPLTFIPSQTGTYAVTLYGWCDTKICDSCTVYFKVNCDSLPCCPYEIKITPKAPTYTAVVGATIVKNNFTVSIPAIANITEVRANVVSYTIDDNYKKECMQCVNFPFTWASIATATNINTAPPKITMYGGATVTSFNGSGAGIHQNPREIIWNNGTNLNAPTITNIGMSFILP
ncbi:MAG: PKD domain-containing protein, partial [Ferruginibacter sp.]|nr:PKD domain-containing protein [Ferruginibacter sp.]